MILLDSLTIYKVFVSVILPGLVTKRAQPAYCSCGEQGGRRQQTELGPRELQQALRERASQEQNSQEAQNQFHGVHTKFPGIHSDTAA